MKLSEIMVGQNLLGVLPHSPVKIASIRPIGEAALDLIYRTPDGILHNQLVYADVAAGFEPVSESGRWTFDADGALFRLVSEATRIRLAHLFDPQLAVHTSMIEPLPHQITAVYGELLTRHPLRYLLADDPGAGKTIMTGLFIKELMLRGDLNRCLIVTPGNLSEQWQDELYDRFGLAFDIMTNDRLEAARSGNAFQETPLCIARLDKLSRNEDLQQKLRATEWDLIVCDEAHKLSASLFGNEVKYTKRYQLGQLLSGITRHFLLLTATPHNGKEADFQLFMALLDGDRFEGQPRAGSRAVDVSDLMRRMVKEDLLKFDGTPLFPERRAYTLNYTLSDAEAALYRQVTEYVKEEFNRADRLSNESRRGTVGFALTILQRRLASSPEAIYQSLRRRKERLESRLAEEKLLKRGMETVSSGYEYPVVSPEDIEDIEDAPDSELEKQEEDLVDQATAARSIAELEAEIQRLDQLVGMARALRDSRQDRKWEELSRLLQDDDRMFDVNRTREKLIIFTEHRDTLDYLAGRIRSLLGRPESVVTIQGGMLREDRRKVQERFTQDRDVRVLVATDAAGEGINLQRAHLMINYDLPWNPNRLEQRFGRIHRIGQTEVCHLWSLVAKETREGDVFQRLFDKLDEERRALGGRVFDILGKVTYEDRPLRELLVEAIRYGDLPEVRARLTQVVETALDTVHLRRLLDEGALAKDTMDLRKVLEVREEMERIEARRLQPHFVEAFFLEAFRVLKGSLYQREPRRYEISHVPQDLRLYDRAAGTGEHVLSKYERICFEKELIEVPGKPLASLICPGHPLLEAVIGLLLERHGTVLQRGAVLVDETATNSEPRVLVALNSAIEGESVASDQRCCISERFQFVEIDGTGRTRNAGYAPYLDFRPLRVTEQEKATSYLAEGGAWLHQIESIAESFAVAQLIPDHMRDVTSRTIQLIEKTRAAVIDRLKREINHWDARAEQLKLAERAGRNNAKLNSGLARKRADDLEERLTRRLVELDRQKQMLPLPPRIVSAVLVLPVGLFQELPESSDQVPETSETKEMERIAMEVVFRFEREMGFNPVDVSDANVGYDIESKGDGRLRMIEVKGRRKGASTVTVTRNEVLTALNKPENFILAIIEVDGGIQRLMYLQRPFSQPPDFCACSVNYTIRLLPANGQIIAEKEYLDEQEAH